MHEPLTIAIYFPFLKSKPWQLKGCQRLLDTERNLQRVFSDNPGTERYLLRELWHFTMELPAVKGVGVTAVTKLQRRKSFTDSFQKTIMELFGIKERARAAF